jgi:hypothetical protein
VEAEEWCGRAVGREESPATTSSSSCTHLGRRATPDEGVVVEGVEASDWIGLSMDLVSALAVVEVEVE